MQFTIPFSLPFALSLPSLFSIHLERTNHLSQPCDPKRPSYRMMQCASFNDKMPLSDNKLHNWTAHMARNLDPCILYCLNEENSFVILQKMVNDSTPCKAGTNNMCVAGLCRVRHITSLFTSLDIYFEPFTFEPWFDSVITQFDQAIRIRRRYLFTFDIFKMSLRTNRFITSLRMILDEAWNDIL